MLRINASEVTSADINNPFTSLKKNNTGRKSKVCEEDFLKLIHKHAEVFRNLDNGKWRMLVAG